MTSLIRKSPEQKSDESNRTRYHSPRLSVYGAIRELTQSGSNVGTETTQADPNSAAGMKRP